jgi:uncharacterized protein YndB with AHSA1/START domain
MFWVRTPTPWLALLGAVIAVPLLAAACSTSAVGTGSSNVPDLSQGPRGRRRRIARRDALGGRSLSGPLDPCTLLTKADVQPFFSVPIVTELPGPVPGTCEWAANDSPGGVNTSLDVWVTTGQDALDTWTLASGPGPKTMFSGVGDQAEHYPNVPDFVSNKGGVTCKYMHGTDMSTDWTAGGPIIWRGEWKGHSYEDKGTVLAFEPERLLTYTHWSPMGGSEDTPENYHTVTYELIEEGGTTTLTLTQDNNATQAEADTMAENNWGPVLLGLKETAER